MEIASGIFGTLAVILGFLAVMASENRDARNWLACFGIVSAELSFMCLYQSTLWKRDAQETKEQVQSERTKQTTIDLVSISLPEFLGTFREGNHHTGVGVRFHNLSSIPLTLHGFEFRALHWPIDTEFFASRLERLKKVAVHAEMDKILPPGDQTVGMILPDVLSGAPQGVFDGSVPLHCFGCVIYADSGGALRSTTMCSTFDPYRQLFMSQREYEELNQIGTVEPAQDFEIPKRPLLMIPQFCFVDFEVGKEGKLLLSFRNNGGTKADKLSWVFRYALKERDAPKNRNGDEAILPSFCHVTEIEADSENPIMLAMPPLTQDEMDSIRANKKALQIYGTVEYADLAGGLHYISLRIEINGNRLKSIDGFQKIADCDSVEYDDNAYGV